MTTQIKAPPASLQVWINQWLSTRGKLPGDSAEVIPLKGDGSQRSFYRLKVKGVSYVVLHDQEWISSKDYAPHQTYLRSQGIPVPDFVAVDPAAGIIVMGDLGDELLQARIQAKPDEKLTWLEQAVDTLAHFHGKAWPVPHDLPGATRSFDRQKYGDELRFTLEHLHQKFLDLPPLGATALGALERFCERIAAFQPAVLCHRDYHTRNLMLCGQQLFLVDFQDARLGSPHYDVASLVYDAYLPLTGPERTRLLSRYKKSLAPFLLAKAVAWDRFASDVDPVAFQRTVKAAGSFASFYTRYGKGSHLPYLIPCLESVQQLETAAAQIEPDIASAFPVKKWLAKIQEKGGKRWLDELSRKG